MTKQEIKVIIRKLKNHDMDVLDVPKELEFNKDILKVERKLGLRLEGNRGYDVIENIFFVEEVINYGLFDIPQKKYDCKKFESFDEYFEYLDGDIYTNACYKFINLDRFEKFIKAKRINIKELIKTESFVDETIDEMVCEPSAEELEEYEKVERLKPYIKNWLSKFNACSSGKALQSVVEKFNKSSLKENVDLKFFLYGYIFKDTKDQERLDAVMEYLCSGAEGGDELVKVLCLIWGTNVVLEKYNYTVGCKQTTRAHKKKIENFAATVDMGLIKQYSKCLFDEKTHFYCECFLVYEDGKASFFYVKYFESIEELIEEKNSLRNVDLSADIKLKIDISKYEIDKKTCLPFSIAGNVICTTKAKYRNGVFYVTKNWKNERGCFVKEREFKTKYFFDFVHFLKGNLSGADLLFCDGLNNLNAWSGVNFEGAKLSSTLSKKFSIPFEKIQINEAAIQSFEKIIQNEEKNELIVAELNKGDIVSSEFNLFHQSNIDSSSQRIHYISDLHLMHRLQNAECISKNDIDYVLGKIAENIANEVGDVLLIGGDTSSDFDIFKKFVSALKIRLEEKKKTAVVVFILGNHELWNFPNKTINEIENLYREIIEEKGMYFVQNELLYKDSENKVRKISYEKLKNTTNEELRKILVSTRLVILGGLGFSGYNDEFNAIDGIYRDTIGRNEEVEESKKFEALYNKVLPSICDKNTIVFTHTPKKDWCENDIPYKNIVYLSGHTHRNVFQDDGEYRIYADNQVGYKNENPHLKNFIIDADYDCFVDYEDGIYEISREQYNDFYRGKNLKMTYTRDINVLYMLKKNGYYCFIHKNKSNGLSLLNGGALKKLEQKDVNYYYSNMDRVVSYISKPIEEYMAVMNEISKEVIKIGGLGTIHGCIVDIDWFSHVYVNPYDGKLTFYFALDVIDKKVFSSVKALLEEANPKLYDNYCKLIGSKENNLPAISKNKSNVGEIPKEYLGTDIYKASREIKKMQKLSSNILSVWAENSDEYKQLECR